MNITGTTLNYFKLCKRKMWLSVHKLNCEQDSDLVKIGKIYHEEQEKDSIEIDNVKLDGLKDGKVFELKKSKKGSEGARLQVLYYIHVLKEHGIETSGVIKYKENNRVESIELNKESEKELFEAISEIHAILNEKKPPKAKRIKYCKMCSYNDFCFS